jgi:hypothetical protein
MKPNMLETQKEKLLRQATWMAEQTNDWMMIRDYMNNRLGELKLTEPQKQKLRRYQFAYDQISSGKYTEMEVIAQMVEHFKIAEATAIADLKCSKEIYSTTLAIDKRFEIKMQIELLKIEQQKARDVGNLDASAKLAKCIAEFLKMVPDEMPDKDDAFTPHQNVLTFNPAILGIPAIDKSEMNELLKTLANKYNFKLDTSFIEIEDAEIISEHED